jgi:hypothetical protein
MSAPMTGQQTSKLNTGRSLKIWMMLLAALILALLIWRYFDIRIEQLKSGSIREIGMLIKANNIAA